MDELPEHLVSVARKPGYNLERDAYVFRGALPAIGDVISVTARFGNVSDTVRVRVNDATSTRIFGSEVQAPNGDRPTG